MAQTMAEIRGRVMIRPWRVGLLADTSDAAAVRDAIANLSSVWGGASMPIFDVNAPVEELELAGRAFDVDSLYADVVDGPVGELLRKPGWAWRGRGPWGPFGSEEGGSFRKGLLPTRAFIDPSKPVVVPTWDRSHPADLVLAATWGITEQLGVPVMRVPYSDLLKSGTPDKGPIGSLAMGMVHLDTDARHEARESGVVLIRPDHPGDVVAFWNLRAFGNDVIGLPSSGDLQFVESLLERTLPSHALQRSDEREKVLYVSGLEHASAENLGALQAAADRDGLSICESPRRLVPTFRYPGLETRFTRATRADVRPEARWVDVDLPRLPLVEDRDAIPSARGVVAAEVKFGEVRGQDPRFTSQLPPYRRHSALVEHLPFVEGVDHVRAGYNGLALGLDAGVEDVRVPFVFSVDVVRLLFDDAAARAEQSDVGKFQTRASEKFGGPLGGLFTQPGVRAAVTLAAGKAAGVTLPHLRGVVEKERGGWPSSRFDRGITPRDYAARSVNTLFNSGLFVPTLKVHCSHCRVESHVSADQLAAVMQCEFCGRSYNLALSHGLSLPEWRYRLAAHLRADQVEALLPALATTSLLGQLRMAQDPWPLVLGLQLTLDGRKVEVDVASYLMDPEWVAVLGEVKTGNRIDAKDVGNLEFLREKLRSKDVRCMLLFATLKERFSDEEASLLRDLVARSTWTTLSRGSSEPNVPLVLTGPDLSRHFWDDDHPWRWKAGAGSGIFGTAMRSCERNLGLRGWEPNRDADGGPDFAFEWTRDDVSETD